MSALHYLERQAAGEPDGLLFLHHGRGADEVDLHGLAELLDPDRRLHVVTPRAPLMLSGWPGYHWYEVLRPGYPTPESFAAGYRTLAAFHDEIWQATGIGPGRTVLAGFSMGAVMSYALGLGADRPAPAGILALSGAIPSVAGWAPDLAGRARLPLLITHGRNDPVIEVSFGRRAAELLAAGGLDVEYLESDLGHQIDPAQLPAVRAWLVNGAAQAVNADAADQAVGANALADRRQRHRRRETPAHPHHQPVVGELGVRETRSEPERAQQRAEEPVADREALRAGHREIITQTGPDGCRISDLQRLAPRKARVDLMPVGDLGLAVDPAQVHLAPVADRGKVDQPAVEIAEHDLALIQRRDRGLKFDECVAELLRGRPAAVSGGDLGERAPSVDVAEPIPRPTHRREPRGEPGQLAARLLECVMTPVAHPPRPTAARQRRRSAPRGHR